MTRAAHQRTSARASLCRVAKACVEFLDTEEVTTVAQLRHVKTERLRFPDGFSAGRQAALEAAVACAKEYVSVSGREDGEVDAGLFHGVTGRSRALFCICRP